MFGALAAAPAIGTALLAAGEGPCPTRSSHRRLGSPACSWAARNSSANRPATFSSTTLHR